MFFKKVSTNLRLLIGNEFIQHEIVVTIQLQTAHYRDALYLQQASTNISTANQYIKCIKMNNAIE